MTSTPHRTTRLNLEPLEDRLLLSALSIVNHGVVQHAGSIDAIFYGPGWNSAAPILQASIQGGLHGVLDPSSSGPNSYLATLKNAHYGDYSLTFQDSTNTSFIAQTGPGSMVTDQDVQDYLSYALNQPGNPGQPTDRVAANSSSRIYLIVVDPNYAVQDYNGNVVQGYHRTFNTLIHGTQEDVNYAVVAIPGGTAHNAAVGGNLGQPQLDTVTAVSSRELIDALTNPTGHGWYAGDGTEIGDANVYAYVNNQLVVRPLSKKQAWMLPVQAAAPDHVTFLLDNSGVLWERFAVPSAAGSSIATVPIAGQVAKVSDQGIDQYGRAMVDYITAAGAVAEFHDGAAAPVLLYSPYAPWSSPLGAARGATVIDAKAGQGVSYVLFSNGNVWEYNDVSAAVRLRDQSVIAIDAGTTFIGVNMVDTVASNGKAWEIPDSGRRRWLKLSNVVQISAGRQGRTAEIDATGTAWVYQEHGGLWKVATGVTAAVSGFDAAGNYVVDLVFAGTGALSELDYATAADGKLKPNPVLRTASHLPAGATTPVSTLALGGTISKMRAGVIDMIFADGAFEGTINGAQTLLGSNLQRAL